MNSLTTTLLHKKSGLAFLMLLLLSACFLPKTVMADSSYSVNRYGELTTYSGSPNVTIRSNTSAISTSAFDKVKTSSFTVASGNQYYKSINGVLFNKSGTMLVRFPTERGGSYTIPSTVTKIAGSAFYRCNKLTKITMSNKVTTLDSYAFSECSKLETVTLSNAITELPYEAFSNDKNLKKVHMPSKLQKISELAFDDCFSLSSITIPSGVDTIESQAFSGCRSLTSVTLPDDLSDIEYAAFEDCYSLAKVSYGKNMTYIPSQCFANCEKLTTVTNIENVETINYEAFGSCKSLKNISLPKELESVSSYAFYGCGSIGKITIGKKVVHIDNTSFNGAGTSFQVAKENKKYSSADGLLLNKNGTKLIQVPKGTNGALTIPKGVTNINATALQYSNIKSVRIPEGVTKLSKWTFSHCKRLVNIALPASLKTFEAARTSPFDIESDNVKNIEVAADNPYFSVVNGALYNKNETKLLYFPPAKRGSFALSANCKNLNNQLKYNKLTSITIPASNPNFISSDGVLYDNRGKVMRCYPLKRSVYTIPKKVNNVDYLNKVRESCNIKSIKVAKANKTFTAKDGVLFKRASMTLLFYPPMKQGAYVIPDDTRHIDEEAFCATQITKLTISKNITRSAYTTYYLTDCKKLTEVTVKQGKLNSITLNFDGSKQLKKITLPSTIMTMKLRNLPKKVTIYGWDNTEAKKIAKKAKGSFVSLGTIPAQVSGIKAKKIIDTYELSWNKSSNVSGYQVYTKYETIANLSGADKTSCKIKDLRDNYDKIYVRAYITKGKQKIYGKAKAYYVK
ncbi:MAG: leucine-rich repeat protein [Lachnospira sp.]|nr:leucine-rich repeat protein [Lachnospira sp.]